MTPNKPHTLLDKLPISMVSPNAIWFIIDVMEINFFQYDFILARSIDFYKFKYFMKYYYEGNFNNLPH